MKANEIKVGGYYKAKVSNKVVTVRVDAIREVAGIRPVFGRTPYSTRYDVTNTVTGRKTTFKSAMKFRNEVLTSGPIHSPMMALLNGKSADIDKGRP